MAAVEYDRCSECNCIAPAHYGSCSKIQAIPGMSETLAELERERAERERAERATRQGNSLEQVAKVMRQGQTNSAKLVRDAINAIANDSVHVGWWGALAERETDEVLDRLRRLLK